MTLEIGGSRRGSDTNFEVSVPYGVRVVARTQSGDISVRGTRGEVEAHAQSGDVHVEDVTTRLDVVTISGEVTAASVTGDVEINTVSGDVRMTDLRGNADINTVSGDIELRGVTAKLVRAKTTSGDVTYDGLIDPAGRYEFGVALGRHPAARAARRERATHRVDVERRHRQRLPHHAQAGRTANRRVRTPSASPSRSAAARPASPPRRSAATSPSRRTDAAPAIDAATYIHASPECSRSPQESTNASSTDPPVLGDDSRRPAFAQARGDFRWEKALPAGNEVSIHNINGDINVVPSTTGAGRSRRHQARQRPRTRPHQGGRAADIARRGDLRDLRRRNSYCDDRGAHTQQSRPERHGRSQLEQRQHRISRLRSRRTSPCRRTR